MAVVVLQPCFGWLLSLCLYVIHRLQYEPHSLTHCSSDLDSSAIRREEIAAKDARRTKSKYNRSSSQGDRAATRRDEPHYDYDEGSTYQDYFAWFERSRSDNQNHPSQAKHRTTSNSSNRSEQTTTTNSTTTTTTSSSEPVGRSHRPSTDEDSPNVTGDGLLTSQQIQLIIDSLVDDPRWWRTFSRTSETETRQPKQWFADVPLVSIFSRRESIFNSQI